MRRLTLAAAIASSCLLAGCGINDPLAGQSFPGDDPAATSTSSSMTTAPPAAVRAAEQYAVSARGFTPDTLRRNYGRQVDLSADPLRAALQQIGAPTKREIRAQRQSRARTTAAVLETSTQQAAANAVTLQITLRERAVSTDSVQQTDTVNVAKVERRGHAWKVTAFTAQP